MKKILHSFFLVLLIIFCPQIYGRQSNEIFKILDTLKEFTDNTKLLSLEFTSFGFRKQDDDNKIKEAIKFIEPFDKTKRGRKGKLLSGKESELKSQLARLLPDYIYIRHKADSKGKKCEYVVVMHKEFSSCYTINRNADPSATVHYLNTKFDSPELSERALQLIDELISWSTKQNEAREVRKKVPTDYLWEKAIIKELSFEKTIKDLRQEAYRLIPDREKRKEIVCLCGLGISKKENIVQMITELNCSMGSLADKIIEFYKPLEALKLLDSFPQRDNFLLKIEHYIVKGVGRDINLETYIDYFGLDGSYIDSAFINQIKSDIRRKQHWGTLRKYPHFPKDYRITDLVRKTVYSKSDFLEFLHIFYDNPKEIDWLLEWGFPNLGDLELEEVLQHKKLENYWSSVEEKLLRLAENHKRYGYLLLRLKDGNGKSVRKVFGMLINQETDSTAFTGLVDDMLNRLGKEAIAYFEDKVDFNLGITLAAKHEIIRDEIEPKIRVKVNDTLDFEQYLGVYPENSQLIFPFVSPMLSASQLRNYYNDYNELEADIGELYPSAIRNIEDAKWFLDNYPPDHPNRYEAYERYLHYANLEDSTDSLGLSLIVDFFNEFDFDLSVVEKYVKPHQKLRFINMIKTKSKWLEQVIDFVLIGSNFETIDSLQTLFGGFPKYHSIRLRTLVSDIKESKRKSNQITDWIIPKLEVGKSKELESVTLVGLPIIALTWESKEQPENFEFELLIDDEKIINPFTNERKVYFPKVGTQNISMKIKSLGSPNVLYGKSPTEPVVISINGIPSILRSHFETILANSYRRAEFNSAFERVLSGNEISENDYKLTLPEEFISHINTSLKDKDELKVLTEGIASLYVKIAKPFVPDSLYGLAEDWFMRNAKKKLF